MDDGRTADERTAGGSRTLGSTADKVILGIHGYIDANTQERGDFSQQLTDGHAWLTVTRNGKTEYYGLWPDDHPTRNIDNGPGSDIRVGLEKGITPTASRYYQLDAEQVKLLDAALKQNVTWRYTNTCASWASETTERTTGQDVDADEFLGVETPRELVESIRALEAKQATSLEHPLAPLGKTRSSSLGQLYDTPGGLAPQTELALLLDDPAHPDHALFQHALQGVHALDAQHGRVPDVHSHQLAGALAAHARQAGMTGVDHVLGNQDGSRMVAIQGALDDPAQRRVDIATLPAMEQTLARSTEQMAVAVQDTPKLAKPSPTLQPDMHRPQLA